MLAVAKLDLGQEAGVAREGDRRPRESIREIGGRDRRGAGAAGDARGRVEVVLEPLPELTLAGAERAELRLSPGPAQPVQPVAKAASGGELSRTMLACRSVLADLDEVPTLVFDEVDAGIGGEAGLAVGRRLARLAAGPPGRWS